MTDIILKDILDSFWIFTKILFEHTVIPPETFDTIQAILNACAKQWQKVTYPQMIQALHVTDLDTSTEISILNFIKNVPCLETYEPHIKIAIQNFPDFFNQIHKNLQKAQKDTKN